MIYLKGSQICTKMGTKWTPKRAQIDPKGSRRASGASQRTPKISVHGCVVTPDRFLEPFWGQWDPKGSPKSRFEAPIQHERPPKWCSGGRPRKGSKNSRQQAPQMSVFGEATTSKIELPCRRRAYFAKTGRRGACREKDQKCCQNGP